ncbi:hypothetical protein [Vibrio scophthalmi]|uniref:Uncharacterized protein n=1 Tax=Vibrio scophthalmi TaxID=45658 RepID=A0A1E3WHU7_9VIBR|nr:hypothetical protein [Vibrio scophthalmi]ODS05376.1 hypothetical protein VSF3289_04517 [Vibrio scophthalmi]
MTVSKINRKTKLLIGISACIIVGGGITYTLTKPYFKERARIALLAEQLDRQDSAKEWHYTYRFEFPNNLKVADWNTENLEVPQILFTVANSEDKTKLSYWALNVNGGEPQLLIPEGQLPPPPNLGKGARDSASYMSRSPNGRYMVLPLSIGVVLYDLATQEITKLNDEEFTWNAEYLWAADSSQVIVKNSDLLVLVKLPSKEILDFFEVNDPEIEEIYYSPRDYNIVFNRAENRIYLQESGHGLTCIVDATTFKVIERKQYLPTRYQCNVEASKFGDSYMCDGHGDGRVFSSQAPNNKIATYSPAEHIVSLNGGDVWYTNQYYHRLIRRLAQATPESPTLKMSYSYLGYQNGELVYISPKSFAFSRYVIEHADSEKWRDFLYPLPSHEDLKKAFDTLYD